MARRLPLVALLLASVACRTFLSAQERADDAGTLPDASPGGHEDAGAETHDAGEPSCEESCATSDLSHCSARCELGEDGSARCVVRGLDQDGDGHADAQCTGSEPGDDCDDQDGAIHPGAHELCDGLDNDCNGRIDLQDGLAAAPAQELYLAGQNPALAWNGKAFGMAYEGEGHELLFAKFSAAGKRLFDRAALVPDEVVDASGPDAYPSIQWANGRFAVVWTRPPRVNFMRIDSEGTRSGAIVDVASGVKDALGRSFAAYLGTDRWLVGFTRAGEIRASASVVDAADMISAAGLGAELDAVGTLGLAASDDALATLWAETYDAGGLDDGTSSVWWVRRSLALVPVSPGYSELVRLTEPSRVQSPVIASSPHGYAMAWTELVSSPGGSARRLVFEEFDRAGNERCGPVDLASHFDPGALAAEPISMVYGADSYVLLLGVSLPTGSASSGVDLLQVRPGCAYQQRFRAQRMYGAFQPALASAGDAGFFLAWQNSSSDRPSLGVQKLGPHLCD